MSDIQKVYAIATMYPDGQKTDAAAVEYDKIIDNNALGTDQFRVQDRTILKVYANDEPARADAGQDGCYVILELSEKDSEAAVIREGKRTQPGPPPPKEKVIPQVCVEQIADIQASDGTVIPASETAVTSEQSIEPVVDDFLIGEYNGLKYNLYIPKDYDPEKEYPLVLFIADIGANGLADRMALAQGIGGTVWATEEEQAKHPCFVLVPQFPFKPIMNDDFTFDPMFNLIKPLLDYICESYSIDRNRIYGTGQSQGCMAVCELNVEYPDLFAGCMLVAGQWDPEALAENCTGKPLWILVSEADDKASPGMDAIVSAMEDNGAVAKNLYWDAKASRDDLTRQAQEACQDGADIYFTHFIGDSVIPDDDNGPERLNHAHASTWPVAYDIEGVRDWLFSCVKDQ